MSQQNRTRFIDPAQWVFVKERGAVARSGGVYRSRDGERYLRTGERGAIREEAAFAEDLWRRGFPVPKVMEIGVLPNGLGYFVETSAGEADFGALFRQEYAATGAIGAALFEAFCDVTLQFLAAQIDPANRQHVPSQLRDGILLGPVLAENPEIPVEMAEQAVAAAEERTRGLPLVLTHGDLTPFNVMGRGVIDFELRFIAPAGYDVITCITFQRFWGHPQPDGTGTMRGWDFSRRQIADYLAKVDTLCEKQSVPPIAQLFDDFLMLKAIWALCYERPDDEHSIQADRWRWRKRVALHCLNRCVSRLPIESEAFGEIGSDQARDPKKDQQ